MTFAVALTIMTAGFTIIAWRDLRLGLAVLFALLPAYLLRFSLGPIPSTALELIIVAAACVWIAQGGLKNLRTLRPFAAPIGLLLASSFIAVAVAPSLTDALGLWRAYIAEPLLVFAMLVTTLKTPDDWRRTGVALMTGGLVVALLAIAQWVTGIGIPAPWDIEKRVTSVFDFPNAVGLYLAPIATLTIALAIRHRNIAFAATALVMLGAIFFAKTEAALIAIPAALLIALLLSYEKVNTKYLAVVGAALLFFVAIAAIPAVREKILLSDISGQARTAMWKETLFMLADQPLTGAGIAGFPTTIVPYHDASYFEIFQYPHNVVLNIWTELGILGVVAAVVIAVQATQAAWKYRRDPHVLMAFAMLLTMVIHGLVDVPFFKNDLAVMTAGILAFLAWHLQKHPSH